MKQVTLSKVFKKNWDYILKLRNENFEMFYKQDKPLSKKDHYNYLTKQKKNKNFHHWIINYDEKPVGYVRLLNHDIGIIIDKKFQNKGIAGKALILTEKKASEYGLKKLVALVKPGNTSSSKLFKKNDYSLQMFWYEKKLK